MDAERLERAARALLDVRDFEWSGHAEVDGHRGFFQACPACGGLRPDMAPRSLKNLYGHGKRCPLVALRAALAAQPAQAGEAVARAFGAYRETRRLHGRWSAKTADALTAAYAAHDAYMARPAAPSRPGGA